MSNLRIIDPRTNTKAPDWFRQTVADLERHEGFRPYAYPDPVSKIGAAYSSRKYGWGTKPARSIVVELGLNEINGRPWTVGHGFTKGVTIDSVITHQQSTRRLESELRDHVIGLDRLVPKWETALPLFASTTIANMAYNLGIERLSKFTTTIDLLNKGRYAEAGHNLKKSLWFKQTKVRAVELTDRLINGSIAKEYLI
jgi:GH24 family phage-related lysozyme (muramidase)